MAGNPDMTEETVIELLGTIIRDENFQQALAATTSYDDMYNVMEHRNPKFVFSDKQKHKIETKAEFSEINSDISSLEMDDFKPSAGVVT